MRSDRSDIRQRHQKSILVGRELAARLAQEAEEIADTFDHLARLHEELAATDGHPLARGAAARAAGERALADQERASSVRFREIASGSLPPPGPPRRRAGALAS